MRTPRDRSGVHGVGNRLGFAIVTAALGAALWALFAAAVGGGGAVPRSGIVLLALLIGALARGVDGFRIEAASRPGVGGWRGGGAEGTRWSLATGLSLLMLEGVGFWEAARAGGMPARISMHSIIGVSVALVGIGLRWLAQFELGSRFSDTHSIIHGRELVRSGIYALVRHPSELGLLLFSLGLAVALESGHAMIVWVLLVLPTTLKRVSLEEACLIQEYGDVFAAYRKRTPRMLPW